MNIINIVLYASLAIIIIIPCFQIKKITDQILLFIVSLIILCCYNLVFFKKNKVIKNIFNNPPKSINNQREKEIEETEEHKQVKKYAKEDSKIFSLWYKNIYNDIKNYGDLLNPQTKLKNVSNKHYINRDCLHDLTCL